MRSEHMAPRVTPINEPQFTAAQDGVLVLQWCDACGEHWYLPSTNCPNCLSTDLSFKPASGRGHVWSWIVMHQQYLPGFKDEIPYVVAAIVLDEGPMLMSTVDGIDAADIVHDMPVQASFEPFGPEGRPLPVFIPVP